MSNSDCTTPTKTCSECGVAYPATAEFWHRDKTRPDGFTYNCKACRAAISRKYREANQEKEAERGRKYREANRDRIAERGLKYRQANREKLAERDRKYRANNHEKILERGRKYREANPDKGRQWRAANLEHFREYLCKWREANREYARKYAQEYREANPEYAQRYREANREKYATYHRNYMARKKNNGGTHTAEDIGAQYDRQKGKCFYCGVKVGDDYHADHVIPLVQGGSNSPENIVVACPSCNCSKSAKHPMDFCGRLL